MTKEKVVESALVTHARERGLLCLKFTSPGTRGVPDRIILGHGPDTTPRTVFVEVKRPGEKMRPAQQAMAEKMRSYGAHVLWIDNADDAARAIDIAFGFTDGDLTPYITNVSRPPVIIGCGHNL